MNNEKLNIEKNINTEVTEMKPAIVFDKYRIYSNDDNIQEIESYVYDAFATIGSQTYDILRSNKSTPMKTLDPMIFENILATNIAMHVDNFNYGLTNVYKYHLTCINSHMCPLLEELMELLNEDEMKEFKDIVYTYTEKKFFYHERVRFLFDDSENNIKEFLMRFGRMDTARLDVDELYKHIVYFAISVVNYEALTLYNDFRDRLSEICSKFAWKNTNLSKRMFAVLDYEFSSMMCNIMAETSYFAKSVSSHREMFFDPYKL